MAQHDSDSDDVVSLEYTAEAGLHRERRQMDDLEVIERMGQVVRMDPPYDDDDLILVLDPEGDLWARERGKPSTDGFFGSNAELVEG